MNKTSENPNLRVAKRVFALLAIFLLLLFLGRLAYSLVTRGDYPYYYDYGYSEFLSAKSYNNIATNKVSSTLGNLPDLNQKYERIASLTVKSLQFEADLVKSQAAIEAHDGLVQMENSGGLEGNRQVQLTIGVRPEAFDALREGLMEIGQVTGTNVVTKDMTNEYRQLLAEQESLERRMESYEAIKGQGGSLQEQLALEALIMEADGVLQKLRVSLGEYSDERALCTVDFTLYEGSRANLVREMMDAAIWAASVFAVGAGIALLAVLTSLAVAMLWNYFATQKTTRRE